LAAIGQVRDEVETLSRLGTTARVTSVAVAILFMAAARPSHVYANSAPSIAMLQSSVSSNEATLAVVYGNASDPDGDPLTYTASVGDVEPWANEPGANVRWAGPGYDGPDAQTVTVTVHDNHGNSASTQIDWTINNVSPEVFTVGPHFVPSSSVSPRFFRSDIHDPGADTVATDYRCGQNAPVADGDWFEAYWHWFKCSFSVAGTYQVGVHATDSDGASADSFVSVVATPKVKSIGDGYMRVVGKEQYRPLGGSVAFADLNGDGKADLVIGNAPPDYDDGYAARYVYVVFGRTSGGSVGSDTIAGSVGFRISGAPTEVLLGTSLARAGDVNGDGIDDLIVGCPRFDSSHAGGAYVVYGRPGITNVDLTSMTLKQGFRIAEAGGHAGQTVVGGGDLNGDGLADVVVGAPTLDGGVGAAYVVMGQSERTAGVDLTLAPATYGARISGGATTKGIGAAIAVGDVNGDGIADVALGGSSASLKVVLGTKTWSGQIDVDAMQAATGYGVATGFSGGVGAVAAGDMNGDHFADVLAQGSAWDAQAGEMRSQAMIFTGASTGAVASKKIIAPHQQAIVALAMTDWTGDGRADALVGVPGASENDEASGSAYVVPGASTLTDTRLENLGAWTRVDGDWLQSQAGAALAGGDFNGDGGMDLAVGAPTERTEAPDPITWGRASIFLGTKRPDSSAPSANPPTQTIAGSRVLTPSPTLRVSWSAARDNVAVASYRLQRSTNGGPWSSISTSAPMARFAELALAAGGNSYRFRVRAIDPSGNASSWAYGPTFKVKLFQENSSSLSYAGSWTRTALSGASGGYVSYTATAGRTATLTFTGRAVGFVTTLGPNRGMVRLKLDGATIANIDLYSPTTKAAWVSFSVKTINASHTLTMLVLSTKNVASTGTRVDVDGLAIVR